MALCRRGDALWAMSLPSNANRKSAPERITAKIERRPCCEEDRSGRIAIDSNLIHQSVSGRESALISQEGLKKEANPLPVEVIELNIEGVHFHRFAMGFMKGGFRPDVCHRTVHLLRYPTNRYTHPAGDRKALRV